MRSVPLWPGRLPAAALVAVGLAGLACAGALAAQEYSVEAIRYGTVEDFPLQGLIPEAHPDSTLNIAMVIWLIRGQGHTILFDSGYFREEWTRRFDVVDFIPPDEAVRLAGVEPSEVTDIVVSHAHWDHMGGLELFPGATVWIQESEYRYYTGDAWQEGGGAGGIDRRDVLELVRRNTEGRVRFVDGDDVEIFPGIRALTGARHTYASQYLLLEGAEPLILASDNCYLSRQLDPPTAGATFRPEDREANLTALERMLELAGDPTRVVPGHDAGQFSRFSTRAAGRVAVIR